MSETHQVKNFIHAMSDFVVDAESFVPAADNTALFESAKEIADMLRIARCELSVVDDNDDLKSMLLTDNRDYDSGNGIDEVKHTGDGNRADIRIYPYIGAESWSEIERKRIRAFLSILFIVYERVRAQFITEKLIYNDSETGLYNLRHMKRAMTELIENGEITQYICCRFNPKNFSGINIRLGRKRGTEVLCGLAKGLSNIIGEDGVLCRITGDRFAVIFKKPLLRSVQKYLVGTTVKTDESGDEEISLMSYAGYYDITDGDCAAEDILDRAGAAETIAESSVKSPYIIYDEKLRRQFEEQKLFESIFPDALKKEEFVVYYQPKVNSQDCALVGAEALCRWIRDGEVVAPYRFIPVLEASNYICELDFYMLEHVCRDIRSWLDKGLPVVRVSVNLSRVHLGDESLSEQILKVVDKYSIPHEYIEIELTETTSDVDFAELKQIVNELRDMDICTSVDDFGVGYSSLNLIRDLPWNVLKIDRSFLPEASDDNREAKAIILEHVISMAQRLGLECIVEGVETKDQIEMLKSYNCFNAQGFYFDKPMPAVDFEKRLAEDNPYTVLE